MSRDETAVDSGLELLGMSTARSWRALRRVAADLGSRAELWPSVPCIAPSSLQNCCRPQRADAARAHRACARRPRFARLARRRSAVPSAPTACPEGCFGAAYYDLRP